MSISSRFAENMSGALPQAALATWTFSATIRVGAPQRTVSGPSIRTCRPR